MGSFFDSFPKVAYDITGNQLSNYQMVTNIFFRLRVLRSVLNNISAYFTHTVTDADTPEILAEKVYGDAQAHWIIMLANNIVDGAYDWPLNNDEFEKYIIGKYGSVPLAQTTIHHYEKVVTRVESLTGLSTETRFVVNQTKLTDNSLNVPYDYYEGTGSLPETQSVSTYNLQDGRTVVETIRRDDITCYDYEDALNEAKRQIKIIKPEYYPAIMEEFNGLTKNVNSPYLRKVR